MVNNRFGTGVAGLPAIVLKLEVQALLTDEVELIAVFSTAVALMPHVPAPPTLLRKRSTSRWSLRLTSSLIIFGSVILVELAKITDAGSFAVQTGSDTGLLFLRAERTLAPFSHQRTSISMSVIEGFRHDSAAFRKSAKHLPDDRNQSPL